MKHIITLGFLFVTLFAGAQQSIEAASADSVQYHVNADSTVSVFVMVGTVPFDQYLQFLNIRAQTLDNQASLFKQEAARKDEKARRERERYEQLSGKPAAELYKDQLEKIVDDWIITIGSKSDQLTIASDGSFTSQKSGPGQIKFLAVDNLILSLEDGTSIELFQKGEDWVTADGKAVTLRRVKASSQKIK